MPFVWIPGNLQKVAVPEGRRGPWSVERFRSKTKRLGWGPSARTFTRLVHADHGIFMSDTPEEMRDHREAALRAHGSCLINGLGLGMILAAALRKPDVIALVGPTYADDPRLTIVHADAFTYQPPPGRRYAMVWHDIWHRISPANLESMAALMRKYEPIAELARLLGRRSKRPMRREGGCQRTGGRRIFAALSAIECASRVVNFPYDFERSRL